MKPEYTYKTWRNADSPAQRTVDFAVLGLGSDAFRAESVETNQDARVVVVVLAQKAQQRVAAGRGLVAGHRARFRLRHSPRQTAAVRWVDCHFRALDVRRGITANGSCAVLRCLPRVGPFGSGRSVSLTRFPGGAAAAAAAAVFLKRPRRVLIGWSWVSTQFLWKYRVAHAMWKARACVLWWQRPPFFLARPPHRRRRRIAAGRP